MKIIVLAGGLSTERDVSLCSGAGICRTLRERGHKAILLDVFLGLPDAPENLEDVFDLPDGNLGIAENISTTEPDIEAVKAVKINPTVSLDRMSLNSAVWQTSPSSDFTAVWARMAVFRQLLIFWASVTPVLTLLEMHSPWTRV